MAVSLLGHVMSDLSLGKPALRSLPITATIAEVLSELRASDDHCLSVWSCDHTTKNNNSSSSSYYHGNEDDDGGDDECKCVGKVCMADVICYLSKEHNLSSPSAALKAPVSSLLPKIPALVAHLLPSSSLLEAIDLILQGAQNLVLPIKARTRRKQNQKLSATRSSHPTTIHNNGQEFCWLTQEDIIRFLLNSIGLFSPIPALPIKSLGIINPETITIQYHSPASSTISRCLTEQTSVAVVDSEGFLIGELSQDTLACCDETVAAAAATLSAGDLMAYIDCGGPPGELVRVVIKRLKERGLEAMLQEFTNSPSMSPPFTSSSSDEESSGSSAPEITLWSRSRKYSRPKSYSARMVRRAEAIVCHPKSSLAAVMIQAIAHRVNYVWVAEDDCSLVGIVTFCDMLKVFREHFFQAMA